MSAPNNVIRIKRTDYPAKELLVFKVAWDVVQRSKDSLGKSTTVNLQDFTQSEQAAVALAINNAYFQALHQERGPHKAKWKTVGHRPGRMVRTIKDVGNYFVSNNEKKGSVVYAFPNFDDGGFPAFQVEEQLRRYHDILVHEEPGETTHKGMEYRIVPCSTAQEADALKAFFRALAIVHGFNLSDNHILAGGGRYEGKSVPVVFMEKDIYDTLKTLEAAALPALPRRP